MNEKKKHVFRNLLVKEFDMLSAYVLIDEYKAE